jgi:UPF0716 family protein affecting phage T7 exclusion
MGSTGVLIVVSFVMGIGFQRYLDYRAEKQAQAAMEETYKANREMFKGSDELIKAIKDSSNHP